jgi:hypothetical protein
MIRIKKSPTADSRIADAMMRGRKLEKVTK